MGSSTGTHEHLALVDAIRDCGAGHFDGWCGHLPYPRKEYGNIVFNLILLALAAFVAYGRFVVVPL